MVTGAIGPPPEWFPDPCAPSYYPLDTSGLELGGGTHPRRLKFKQFDLRDWSGETGVPNMPPYDIGDARKLPYGDGEFDHVFASNLLEHFQDTTAILTEWARVLRLDGFLELVVPDAMGILYDHFSGKDKWGVTQERLLGSRSYEGNQHYRAFTVSTFSEVIAQVPLLNFSWAVSCYDGGGIHSLAVKRPVL